MPLFGGTGPFFPRGIASAHPGATGPPLLAGGRRACPVFSESTVIEFGTPREVLFACKHATGVCRRVSGCATPTDRWIYEVAVVAVQYHPGKTAVAARFLRRSAQLDREIMTPTTPVQDLATQWKSRPAALSHLFRTGARVRHRREAVRRSRSRRSKLPAKRRCEQANQWLERNGPLVQVHQLRQFLQTSSLVTPGRAGQGLLQHFLAKSTAYRHHPRQD